MKGHTDMRPTTDLRKAILLIALVFLASLRPALEASVSVGGAGLFGNAELRRALQLLDFDEDELNSRKIDDGAFLMLNRLTQSGYLEASLSAKYTTADGAEGLAHWTSPFEAQIAADVVVEKLHYEIEKGPLYYYRNVAIEGLSSIDPQEALAYFIPDASLFTRKNDRSYSPSILQSQEKQLTAALLTLGRIEATVTASSTEIDPKTGAVDVTLTVDEGPLYKISKAEVHFISEGNVEESQPIKADANYTRYWVEDQARRLRNDSYHLGYPDTNVTSRIIKSNAQANTVAVQLRFEVRRGPKIVLSDVVHQDVTNTHRPLLNRKADLATGQALDITKTEEARRRLSQLGIFERIDLNYQEDGPGQRKAIFKYENSERIKAQLLAGYGSYEQLRAGTIARRQNLFGRAHSLSFSAIRSLKSTTGLLDYTVPELLGESIAGTFEINFLDREELYFDRTERGISLGLFTRLPKLNLDVGVDYALDRKRSSDPQFNTALRLEDTNVGSVSFRSALSTLDNLLYPTAGYELNIALRYAAKALGGQTEFIRPEISSAYHRKLGSRWLFHMGAKGGMVSSPGDNATEIPNGERFLVGGENSLRGYRRGEAGPVDSNGIPIGAEAFALVNLELEYPILNQLNLVIFADTARVWSSTGNLDAYEDLASLGIGFRYNTIVGPVRLEYGHNLDPRLLDPTGTLHLSIGFPF